METVHIRVSKTKSEVIRNVSEIVNEKLPDGNSDLRSRINARIAAFWFDAVHADFQALSAGGTGWMGTGKWKPLNLRYIAYSRGGEAGKEERAGTGQAPNNRKGCRPYTGMGEGTGYMDEELLDIWWDAYGDFLEQRREEEKKDPELRRRRFTAKKAAIHHLEKAQAMQARGEATPDDVAKAEKVYRLIMGEHKKSAASHAYTSMGAGLQKKQKGSRRGRKAKFSAGGGRQLRTKISEAALARQRILFFSGALQNSFKPTSTPGPTVSSYQPSDHQLFQVEGNTLKLGTLIEYAGRHHQDEEKGTVVPERRFWPEEMPKWVTKAVCDIIAEEVAREVVKEVQWPPSWLGWEKNAPKTKSATPQKITGTMSEFMKRRRSGQ